MSKKFRLLMVLVLMTGLLGGLLTGSTVSADPIPGRAIQIPRIDLWIDYNDDEVEDADEIWNTKIQVQNVGGAGTWAAIVYWGGNYKPCEPNEEGAIGWQLQWIPTNGVWTAIPLAGAKSAIVWSLGSTWTGTITTLENDVGVWAEADGSELAVTVDRWGKDPIVMTYEISSSYVGISEAMEGPAPYRYFAPYVMRRFVDALDTVITIQNSGGACTSVWIWYKEQGNCEYQVTQHILELAKGESIRVGSPAAVANNWADVEFPIGFPWLGSAYIEANQPLGIIVDQLSVDSAGANRAVLLTFRALPYKQLFDLEWYADLLYREISGWDASIQVQNLTQVSKPTFVTVDFMDQSGDEILFVGDWVCRNGSVTFYLPAITDLGVNYPFGYVGAAEIASRQQVDYPGEHHDGEPIFALVDIKKRKTFDPGDPLDPTDDGWRYTGPGENQGGAYNAHPRSEKENATGWAMPFIAMEGNGVTSRIALRNNANCNKFWGKIWIWDETGGTTPEAVGVIHTPWLHPKHLKIIDLAYQGFLYPGFVGAATFEVLGVEQLCDQDFDGLVDYKPVMPSIVVMNYGWEQELPFGGEPGAPVPPTNAGDLTRVYEAIPYMAEEHICYGDVKGNVYSDLGQVSNDQLSEPYPLDGATVEVEPEPPTTTDSTGWYRITDLAEGIHTGQASKTGFATCTADVEIPCNDQVYWNPELRCQAIDFSILVTQENGAFPVYDAEVTCTWTIGDDEVCVDVDVISDTTDVNGFAVFDLAAGDGPAGLQTEPGDTVACVTKKAGYDDLTSTLVATDFYTCPNTLDDPQYTFLLCAHPTIYGEVEDLVGNPHINYTVKAETQQTGTVLGQGTSDDLGNYALSISIAQCTTAPENGNFFLRTYAPNSVLVDEEGPYDCGTGLYIDCGDQVHELIDF